MPITDTAYCNITNLARLRTIQELLSHIIPAGELKDWDDKALAIQIREGTRKLEQWADKNVRGE